LMPLTAALVAGLVFAVHPVHVEAVSNIVGFAEIISAAAILLACIAHLRSPTPSGWRQALAIGGLYAIAFGAKESGVTLPGLIFLVDAARQRLAPRDLGVYLRDRWRVYAVMAVVAATLLVGRWMVLGSVANPFPPLGADLLVQIPRIWTLGEVWSHYVRLWILPTDLYADYSPNVIPISHSWHAGNLAGVGVALGILVMALAAWRREALLPATDSARAFAFGVVWFVIAVSPTSNAFFLSGVVLAERTLYLPSVGLALATGWLVARLARDRPRAAAVLLSLTLVLASVKTWTRPPVWRDNQTFFRALLAEAPHSGRAQWILGDEFLKAGNVSQGLLAYRLAINMLGGHYVLVTDVSQRLMEIERWQTAERLLTGAWEQRPEFALAPSLLAWVRAQYGDAIGTERYVRASLALYDQDPTRYHLLAWSLAVQGRWDEARVARERADEFSEGIVFWHRWMYDAYVRRHEGDAPGALAALDSAWASVATVRGREAMDSARVADFGLSSALAPDSAVAR
jgi:tetratricopeptide (TPR) repeat protein